MCDPIQCYSCGSLVFNEAQVCNNCGTRLHDPTTVFRQPSGKYSIPYGFNQRPIGPQNQRMVSYPPPTHDVSIYMPEPPTQPIAPPPLQFYYNQPSQTGSSAQRKLHRSPGAIVTLIFSIASVIFFIVDLIIFEVNRLEGTLFVYNPMLLMIVILGFVFGFIALISGIVTLSVIKDANYMKGKNTAIIGLAISIIMILAIPMMYLLVSNNAMHAGGLNNGYPSTVFEVKNSPDILENNITNDEVAVITLIEGDVFINEIELLVSADGDTYTEVPWANTSQTSNNEPMDQWNDGESIFITEANAPLDCLDEDGNWKSRYFYVQILYKPTQKLLFNDIVVVEASV